MAGLLSSQVIKCTEGAREGEGSLLHLNTTLTEFLPCSGRQEGARYEIGVNGTGGTACILVGPCPSLETEYISYLGVWDSKHI
jgi:hypothetical protein